jgi:hypothetical protein
MFYQREQQHSSPCNLNNNGELNRHQSETFSSLCVFTVCSFVTRLTEIQKKFPSRISQLLIFHNKHLTCLTKAILLQFIFPLDLTSHKE